MTDFEFTVKLYVKATSVDDAKQWLATKLQYVQFYLDNIEEFVGGIKVV